MTNTLAVMPGSTLIIVRTEATMDICRRKNNFKRKIIKLFVVSFQNMSIIFLLHGVLRGYICILYNFVADNGK